MRKTKLVLAVSAAFGVLMSAAWAQEGQTGIITQINRLNRTIMIQQTQSGTVGTSGGAAQEFKTQDEKQLEPFHAGDRVTYSATESGSTKTITEIKKQ
jgi:hypothetical protein